MAGLFIMFFVLWLASCQNINHCTKALLWTKFEIQFRPGWYIFNDIWTATFAKKVLRYSDGGVRDPNRPQFPLCKKGMQIQMFEILFLFNTVTNSGPWKF